jgi:hypothetical protein
VPFFQSRDPPFSIPSWNTDTYMYDYYTNTNSNTVLHFQLFASMAMHLHDSLFIYILLHTFCVCTEMQLKSEDQ